MEDNDLIKGTLHGDDRCFAALVDRYKNMVMAVVSRVVKNREDAEDLTQDVFVKAYLALGKFKGESRFSTWLFRIAYNEASSRYRQGKPDTVAVEDWMNFEQSVDTGCVGKLENLSARQRSQYVQQAMDRLDPRDAMLLTLFLSQRTFRSGNFRYLFDEPLQCQDLPFPGSGAWGGYSPACWVPMRPLF